MNKKAFTLIELLVVVLIIGILAAIAVPQYQKAVLKSQLHRGVSLVESLYQAQQAYLLAHGNFASNIDDLDISLPLNDSCEKTDSHYICDFGKIGMWDGISNVQYQDPTYQIAYLHFLKERDGGDAFDNYIFKKDKRYCYGRSANKTAQEVCLTMGGNFATEATYVGGWKIYLLD